MGNFKKEEKLNSYQGGLIYFCAITAFILLSFLGQAILGAFLSVDSVLYIAFCALFSSLAFLGVVIVFSLKLKSPVKQLSVQKFKPIYIVFSLLLSLGMFFGLGFLNTAVIKLLSLLGLSVSSSVVPLENVGQLLIFILVLAVIPAISEELLFRGLIFNSLSKAKLIGAILTVSVCFSLYHGSIAQLLYQFVYGVLLCLLVKVSKSVIPAIISHFINNFAVLVLEFFKVNINLFNPFIIIGGLICLFVFIFFSVRFLKKEKQDKTEKGVLKEFFMPCGVFGIAISLTLIILGLMVGA